MVSDLDDTERRRLIAIALGPVNDTNLDEVRDAMRQLQWGPLP